MFSVELFVAGLVTGYLFAAWIGAWAKETCRLEDEKTIEKVLQRVRRGQTTHADEITLREALFEVNDGDIHRD